MLSAEKPIRVRIAPSPTGNLHVGTARTALFNYMFAHRHGGKFILRIEDTDLDRSEAQYEQNIYDGLKALGLTWDEGPDVGGPFSPYKQSDRMDTYRQWAEQLQAEGKAYRCYCTEAELDAEREHAQAEKRAYIYSGRCRDAKTVEALQQDASRKPTLRFHVPDTRGDIVFNDIVRGPVHFDAALLGDFVIQKSNGTPTYNFAVVVDDLLMEITHVIRGEDHISNTPRQILLFEALGKPLPQFAHLGMILAPDRSKLSKRHGATAVSEFIAQGYLSEAFCNFLALLGWSPPDGEEVASLDHHMAQFSLDRIAHSGAIFDKAKLDWMNGHLIRSMPLPALLERARPFLNDFDLHQYSAEKLCLILDAVREPITTLGELPEAVLYFFGSKVVLDAALVGEVLMNDDARSVLVSMQQDFLATADFEAPETLAAQFKDFIQRQKPLKGKAVMWPIRVALTGRTHGADLSKTLYILGPEFVAMRLQTALDLVGAGSTV